MGEEPLVAGVELGGTKCICVLGHADGRIVDQVRFATRDPQSTLADIDATLERWSREHGFTAIGIASFGPLNLDSASDRYGSIVSTPKAGWEGVSLAESVERFRVPCSIDTDVIGGARAEQRWGAGQGLADLAYVTVGTGVGVGAIVRDGRVVGLSHGEMGHMRVPRLADDDWLGACPFHGDCVEGLASGPAIRARHGPGAIPDDWAGWVTVEHALAMLVHNLFLATQPRRVIVGGGVAMSRPELIAHVRERFDASLAGYHTAAALGADFLCAPMLGEQAGPLGALAIGIDALTAGGNSSF